MTFPAAQEDQSTRSTSPLRASNATPLTLAQVNQFLQIYPADNDTVATKHLAPILARTNQSPHIYPANNDTAATTPQARDALVNQSTQAKTATFVPEVLQIPGYSIKKLLGRGGMGEVWLAEQETLQRTVAIKLLRSDSAKDVDFAQRFLREARLAARILHPGIVSVFDAGLINDRLYLVMEYVPGGDLRSHVNKQQRLPADEAVSLTIALGEALQIIHDAGLVHRDLKPENILRDGKGMVKIADLGLARSIVGDDRMTVTGFAMGTPAYMSPEQAQGISDIDARSDIYSLAATLFKLLSGRAPYVGSTPWVVVSAVMNEPVPEIRAFVKGISPALNKVILRAMAKNRDERFSTARAFTEALRQAQNNPTTVSLSISARTTSLLRPLLSAVKSLWRRQPRVVGIGIGITFLFGIYLLFVEFSSAAVKSDSVSADSVSADKTEKSANETKSVAQAFGSIGHSFRQLGSAFGSTFRGALKDTLTMSLTAADSTVRSAIKRQGLVIFKEKKDDTQSIIETKLEDKEDLTITLRAQGGSTAISIQIGAMGDQKRSKTVLNWIKAE